FSFPLAGFARFDGFLLVPPSSRPPTAGHVDDSTYSKRNNSGPRNWDQGIQAASRDEDRPSALSLPRSGACPASSGLERPPSPRGAKLMPLPTAAVRRGGRNPLPEPTAPAGEGVPRGHSLSLFSCTCC